MPASDALPPHAAGVVAVPLVGVAPAEVAGDEQVVVVVVKPEGFIIGAEDRLSVRSIRIEMDVVGGGPRLKYRPAAMTAGGIARLASSIPAGMMGPDDWT